MPVKLGTTAILRTCQLTSDRRHITLTKRLYLIRSFAHRGLKDLYNGRTPRYVAAEHVQRLRNILTVLDRSRDPKGLAIPRFRLHPLHGDYKGFWAVTVNGNWRVIFRFVQGDVYDVDYLDYH